jgi:hypothetical protein
VRILPVALFASAVLHGVAMAWIQTMPTEDPQRPPLVTLTPIEIVPPPAVETPPTEVTLLDDHTVLAAAAVASPASHTPRRTAGTPRITTGTTTSTETPASTAVVSPPSTEPPRSKLMTMRRPALAHGPSAAFWDRFAASTKPLAPKDIYSERLADEIASAEGNLKNPKWIANATPDRVTAERARLVSKRHEKSSAELRPDGAGTKAEHQTFRVEVAADGTVKIRDKANIQRRGLGASFDVTDAMMRSKGFDPYSSYKLKVLDETRDERVAIGKRYRTQRLAQSKQHVQKHLERLWATTSELAARKQGLFELWDDCAETGSAEMVAGGAAARSHVVGFIRSKLPAGGGDAYTAEELAYFNKRRKSRATFAPYEAP